jgi:hypothetical protein
MTKITGRKLNERLSLKAAHALFHKDGYWYDQLQDFPGVLFDRNGYVLFPDHKSYEQCAGLRHPEHSRTDGRPGTLVVPNGISGIRSPAYVRDERVSALCTEFGLK